MNPFTLKSGPKKISPTLTPAGALQCFFTPEVCKQLLLIAKSKAVGIKTEETPTIGSLIDYVVAVIARGICQYNYRS